jgi:hypothetical protein
MAKKTNNKKTKKEVIFKTEVLNVSSNGFHVKINESLIPFICHENEFKIGDKVELIIRGL